MQARDFGHRQHLEFAVDSRSNRLEISRWDLGRREVFVFMLWLGGVPFRDEARLRQAARGGAEQLKRAEVDPS
jgi:hypothetical protein